MPASSSRAADFICDKARAISEATGQLMIDFDAIDDPITEGDRESASTIPFSKVSGSSATSSVSTGPDISADVDELRSLALDFEVNGELGRAIEAYRAILLSGHQTAEDHFYLADLLYRSGDLAAARERYYSAIELDEDYVEARANLGCVLAEQGEMPLAEAAFRGALRYHPSFADAHFHLARLLDSMDRPRETRPDIGKSFWLWRRPVHGPRKHVTGLAVCRLPGLRSLRRLSELSWTHWSAVAAVEIGCWRDG